LLLGGFEVPNVLAIAGSPTYPSRTYSLLEHIAQQLKDESFQVDIISARDLPAEDLVSGNYRSAALEPIKALLDNASVVIISTPIYKAAYTGVLKAFLDLLPQKALVGKIVFPVATAGTIAHLLAIDYALKPVLSELGARQFIGTVYAIDKQIQVQPDGSIQLDEDLDQRLKDALNELISTVKNGQEPSKELTHAG
jgi:FMN reductase